MKSIHNEIIFDELKWIKNWKEEISKRVNCINPRIYLDHRKKMVKKRNKEDGGCDLISFRRWRRIQLWIRKRKKKSMCRICKSHDCRNLGVTGIQEWNSVVMEWKREWNELNIEILMTGI